MNDAIRECLEAHVRLVSPVLARSCRRREIEEELLAHLLGVYEEELARLGDPAAAACEAKRRLGDLEELEGELRASVPFLERVLFFVKQGKESGMWRWLLLVGSLAVLVGLGFVFPAVARLQDQGILIAPEVALLVLGVTLSLGGLGSLGFGLKELRARGSAAR